MLGLINGFADRGLLLHRSEESLRARLDDFLVAEVEGAVVGCGALTELGPGLGEVRSLAVREDQKGRGIGSAIAGKLFAWADERGFREVLALTRRVSFFEGLGFQVTQRERFLDKLKTDCQACPLNLCCDETAMVRAVVPAVGAGTGEDGEPRAMLALTEGAPRK
jgi:amino-acid N-acetyltransferase